MYNLILSTYFTTNTITTFTTNTTNTTNTFNTITTNINTTNFTTTANTNSPQFYLPAKFLLYQLQFYTIPMTFLVYTMTIY